MRRNKQIGVNIACAETECDQIQCKQDLVIVFVTQGCSKEQVKTYSGKCSQNLKHKTIVMCKD